MERNTQLFCSFVSYSYYFKVSSLSPAEVIPFLLPGLCFCFLMKVQAEISQCRIIGIIRKMALIFITNIQSVISMSVVNN